MSNQQSKKTLPKQHQTQQPGVETEMNPIPKSINPGYKGSGKLSGKTAIITGGDSGIVKLLLSISLKKALILPYVI